MSECDKCGMIIRKNSIWYSYYNRFGVPTDILFRYCDKSKNELISYYGIDESYFSKPADEAEQKDIEKEYWSQEKARQKLTNVKMEGGSEKI